MMNWILLLIRSFGYQVIFERLRRKSVLLYLKTLQAARKSIGLLIALIFVLQMMAMGFVGAVVTGIWLMPQEAEFKVWCLFGFFGFLFLIPIIVFKIALSERLWYEKSGAKELL